MLVASGFRTVPVALRLCAAASGHRVLIRRGQAEAEAGDRANRADRADEDDEDDDWIGAYADEAEEADAQAEFEAAEWFECRHAFLDRRLPKLVCARSH